MRGSSVTFTTGFSTGISTACLRASRAAAFGADFFLARAFTAFAALPFTLDFAFFDTARFDALARDDLERCFTRFELALRVDVRFFVLAMAVSCELTRQHATSTKQLARHHFAAIRYVN
jgi:hypothetical protein